LKYPVLSVLNLLDDMSNEVPLSVFGLKDTFPSNLELSTKHAFHYIIYSFA